MENNEIKKDELDEVFVDKIEPADKKILVSIIKPFASMDKKGIIGFKENYEKLCTWKKILIYLSCKKALFLKKIIKEESARPKEISQKAIISEGSAKDISRHKILKKIVKKERSNYFIPNYNLKKVKEIILKKNLDKK